MPATSLASPSVETDPSFAELIADRPALSMHAHDGLMLEGVPLAAIARAVGSPVWVMSAGTLRERLNALQDAFAPLGAHIHYAVKANDHLAVLRVMQAGGAGADVVSQGELLRALQAGIAPSRIVFSGVGKTVPDLQAAVSAGIAQVNVESAEELDMLSGVANELGRPVRVALRINPDVDAGTHAKITTGRADNKFGIGLDEVPSLYARAAGLPGVQPAGLALHIGSQIAAMAPYRAAYARAADMVRTLRAAGHAVHTLDCGGGLGIRYRDEPAGTPAAFAGAVAHAFGGMDLQLMIEPGRWLAGPSGLLLAGVVLTKLTGQHRFLVLDAAMNDLARPSLYDAWHGIVPVSPIDALAATAPVDVVGPVCETGDTFARNRALPLLARGSTVAILDTGAYGSVMSSTYNARPLAAQVMVDGAHWSVIRPRQPHAALWADESVPDWLAG
jgi:diaminopimelate decarboxylase